MMISLNKKNIHKKNGQRIKLREYLLNYKFNSLLVRNFVVITLLVLMPSSLVNVFYNINTKNIVLDEINNLNMNSLYRTSDSIEAVMLELFYFTYNISNNNDVIVFSISDRNEITKNKLGTKINDVIKMYTMTNNYIDSIYIYSGKTNLVLHNGSVMDLEDMKDKTWLPFYNTMENKAFAIHATRKNDYYPYYITLICPLYRQSETTSNGAVVLNVDVEKLGRIIGSNNNMTQTFFMVDDSMRLYYCNDYKMMGNQSYAPEYLDFLKDMPASFSQIESINGQDKVVSGVTSARYPWRYVLISPLANFESRMKTVNYFFLQMTVAYLLISLIISFILAVRSFKPVHSIMSVLENSNALDGEYLIKEHHENEVKHITSLVRRTQEQNSRLKLELEERLVKLNNAQMRALQNQIDPHFLYNTLDIINWMAIEKMEGENEVSMMITTLAELLRCSLRRTSYLVSVDEELEHTKLYARILEYKNKEKLKIHWEINPDILKCKIVKLSIQPLMENALNHGLKPRRYHGNIYIKGELVGNTLVICVEDDGVGMDGKKRDALNDHLRTEYQYDDEHVGILNVNQRIKLLFGEEYGVVLCERDGSGLTATIIFPQDAASDLF